MAVVFHWIMAAYYVYMDATCIKGALHAHYHHGTDPVTSRALGGVPTYITIWNMVAQQLYFFMCCREHLLSVSSVREKEKLKRIRQITLRSIMFPTTFVVATVYWIVYWMSPKLIFGDVLNEIYPAWVDHSMHTFIVPIAILELYLTATKERPVDFGEVKGWLIFSVFITVYTIVVNAAHLIRGVWPYPFLDALNNGSPFLFFVYLYVGGGFWYYVGHHLSHKTWGIRHDGRKWKQ